MWYGGPSSIYVETEEEAREAAENDMAEDFDLFSEYFCYEVNYDRLLEFALKQEDFYSTFCDELDNAQRNYFNNNYFEEEDDEE